MFKYHDAFSRNIGWVSEYEQEQLRTKCVAIAGAGGVGSLHMLTLARLGIGNFKISDFDDYEVHNFNRQFGATLSTVGHGKMETMAKMVADINPEASITTFDGGINEKNVDEFLSNVDVYVDSLDFFALNARKLVFQRCYELRIPVVTAAPLGMGSALLCFLPDQMSFEDYFRFEAKKSEEEQLIQFLIGLSPAMLQRTYLADQTRVSFKQQKGPSTVMAVNLCAGIAGTYVLKILLGRGEVLAAPYGLHFDAYRNKLVKTWRPFGNAGLLQRFMFKVAKRIVSET